MNALAMVALAWVCGRAAVHVSVNVEKPYDSLEVVVVLSLLAASTVCAVHVVVLAC